MAKKFHNSERQSIQIQSRWNDKELIELRELKELLGEEKDSTAIKKGVIIAKNVLHNTFGSTFLIDLKPNKKLRK